MGEHKLTNRQAQAAMLAATGRSNKEIAKLMVISDATVENHLYRVYRKLGIKRRSELPVIMRRMMKDNDQE